MEERNNMTGYVSNKDFMEAIGSTQKLIIESIGALSIRITELSNSIDKIANEQTLKNDDRYVLKSNCLNKSLENLSDQRVIDQVDSIIYKYINSENGRLALMSCYNDFLNKTADNVNKWMKFVHNILYVLGAGGAVWLITNQVKIFEILSNIPK